MVLPFYTTVWACTGLQQEGHKVLLYARVTSTEFKIRAARKKKKQKLELSSSNYYTSRTLLCSVTIFI